MEHDDYPRPINSGSGPFEEEQSGGDVALEDGRPKPKEPRRFAVLLHNDDYTTMEFVIQVLRKFFRKTQEEALEITMKVHHEGRGLAGIYTSDIAETKVAQVEEYSRSNGFPLRASAEPV